MAKEPQCFSTAWRNPGHWDIYTPRGRVFCIRGEPNKEVHVFDERGQFLGEKGPRPVLPFKSLQSAMMFIVEEFMLEEG